MKYLSLVFLSLLGFSSSIFAGSESAESNSDAIYGNAIENLRAVKGTRMKMVEGDRGIFFISENGRYSIKGKLFDNWRGRWVKSVDALITSEDVSFDEMGIDRGDLAVFSMGLGDKPVDVFVDPNCQYCRALINDAASLLEDYTFHFYLVPKMGDSSKRAVNTLWCAKDRTDALIGMANKAWFDLPQRKECDRVKLQKNIMLSAMRGVAGVPHIIAWDGRESPGVPTQGIKSWLEGEVELPKLEDVLGESK